jgi:PIN domain nuclease of toxin-antitoxin system
MKVLLDTHAFLWFVLADPRLGPTASAMIADIANEVFVSPASYWEIAIKVSLGKYALTVPFEQFWRKGINANGLQVLPIEVPHAGAVSSLPFHHRDPFDRMLVAQALVEGIPLLSDDATLDAYGIRRIW